MNVIPLDYLEFAWAHDGEIIYPKQIADAGFKKHRVQGCIKSLQKWGLLDENNRIKVPKDKTPETFREECNRQLRVQCSFQIAPRPSDLNEAYRKTHAESRFCRSQSQQFRIKNKRNCN